MNHRDAKVLLGAPVGQESEEMRTWRLERAKRLKRLARGSGQGQNISIAELAGLAPSVAIVRLGLPPGVILDEIRALTEAQRVQFVPFPPLPLVGESVKRSNRG